MNNKICRTTAKEKKPSYSRHIFTRLFYRGGFDFQSRRFFSSIPNLRRPKHREYGLLKDAGKVTEEIAKLHAETEFEKYRIVQDRQFMSDFDKYMLDLEENAKALKKEK